MTPSPQLHVVADLPGQHGRATLADLTDRELMKLIAECEDEDGLVDTRSIVDIAQVVHPKPNLCVGARLSWMRRFGLLAKSDDGTGLWSITDEGRELLSADPSKARVPPSDKAWAASVSAHAMQVVSPVASRMARREWKHYMERRVTPTA